MNDLILAAADASTQDKLRAIRLGFILIVVIGIVGVLLIVALVAAWRNFHKRLRMLEQERDELRQAAAAPDAWRLAGERVSSSPPPGFEDDEADDEDEDDEDPEEDDDDQPGWRPSDDDDDPDDEDDDYGDRRPW